MKNWLSLRMNRSWKMKSATEEQQRQRKKRKNCFFRIERPFLVPVGERGFCHRRRRRRLADQVFIFDNCVYFLILNISVFSFLFISRPRVEQIFAFNSSSSWFGEADLTRYRCLRGQQCRSSFSSSSSSSSSSGPAVHIVVLVIILVIVLFVLEQHIFLVIVLFGVSL